MNSKGQLDNQITKIFILILVFALVIGVVWGLAMLSPVSFGLISDAGNEIKNSVPNDGGALSNATQTTNSAVQGVTGSFEYLTYIVMVSLLIGYAVVCYYVRTTRALAFVWLFVIGFMFVLSMIVSNSYIDASADPTLNEFYSRWGSNDNLFRNLPVIVGVVGVLSGIGLFAVMQREPEDEESVL